MNATEKRGPGRPRIHPDRKAYKAMKEREYRLKRKEAQPHIGAKQRAKGAK